MVLVFIVNNKNTPADMEDSDEDCEEENDVIELSRMSYDCDVCNNISCNLSYLSIHTRSVYVPDSVLCPPHPG